MISAPRVYSQQTWLRRTTHVKFSYRFCKRFFLLLTGLIILTFGIAMAAFSLDRKTLSLAMTLIITVIVFLIILGVVIFYEVRGIYHSPSGRIMEV